MPAQFSKNRISAARLEGFHLLIISGADRCTFLQGQLTQDITTLNTAGTALTGWASAKGRLLAAGQLMAVGDEIWWPLPADIADRIAKRLKMFVLRSTVKIVVSTPPIAGLFNIGEEDHLKIAGQSAPLGNPPHQLTDHSLITRVAGDPNRAWLIGPAAEQTEFEQVNESGWTLHAIRTGLPFIVADTQELFVPQMLNLDQIGAISFDKGCYVGQEIVARTQNLGRIKRRMYRFSTAEAVNLLPGSNIFGPTDITGTVVLSTAQDSPGELLAVVPIQTANEPWFADKARSTKLNNQPLPYL